MPSSAAEVVTQKHVGNLFAKSLRAKFALWLHNNDDDDTCRLVSSRVPLCPEGQKSSKTSDAFEAAPKSAWNSEIFQGLVFASASSLFFSLCSVIVKKLHYMHPSQLACLRFIGIFVCSLPFVLYGGQPPFGPRDMRAMLILRGLVGSTSLFLRFCALHYLPIADASVIIFSMPVFVAVLARIFLKEAFSIFHWISVGGTMIGIVLVTKLPLLFGNTDENSADIDDLERLRPVAAGHPYRLIAAGNLSQASLVVPDLLNDTLNIAISPNSAPTDAAMSGGDVFGNDRLYGIAAALASTIFSASVYVLLRKLRNVDHFVVMFNFGWVAIIETGVLVIFLGNLTMPRSLRDTFFVLVLCVFSFLGQVCLTRALQTEQAGPVSVIRATVDIVLVFIWQILFFADVPDLLSISGAVLVTLCVIFTGLRKWVLSLPESAPAKRRLYFLTY